MKNFAWSFLNTLLTKGFSFIFSIILGNLLLPGELGLFVTLILILTYVVSLFSLNLGGGIVQKLNDVKEKQNRHQFFSAGLLTIVLLSAVASILFLSLQKFILQAFDIPHAKEFLGMLLFLIPLNMIREYLNRVLQADLMFRKLTMLNVTSVIVQITVTVLLVFEGLGVKGVIFGLYSGGVVGVILILPSIIKNFKLLINQKTFQYVNELVRFSSMIFIGSVAILLDQRIDLLFVAHYLDNETVAIYNYALKFSLIFLLFGNSMSKVTYPKLTKAFSSGSVSDINRIFNYSLDFSFIILSLIAITFFFYAEVIVSVLLPEYYLQSIPYLLILFIGIIPKAVISSVGTLFTAKGLPSVSASVNWMMLGVNVLLNIILIPRLGLYGAAIATSTSFILKPFFVFYLLSRKVKLEYSAYRLLLGFTIYLGILIAGHYIQSNLLKALFVFAYAAYGFLLYLSKDEKSYLFRGLAQICLPINRTGK